jgi:hypothetical protein
MFNWRAIGLKWFSIILIHCSFTGRLLAQTTGEWTLNEYPESEVAEVALVDDKLYIIVQSVHSPLDTDKYDYITRIGLLEISSAKSIEYSDKFFRNTGKVWYYGYNLRKISNHWSFVESTYGDYFEDTVSQVTITEDFAVAHRNSKSVHAGLWFYCDVKYNSNSYIGIGSILDLPDSLVAIQYSSNDSIETEINVFRTAPISISFVSSIAFDSIRKRFIVFHLGGISHLNDTLGLIMRYPGSQIHTSQHGNVVVHQNRYYSFGASAFQGSPDLRDLVFQQYDTAMNVLFADTFGRTGFDDYPFIKNSLAVHKGEYIVGGMLAGPYNFNNRDTLRFFLAKYNEQLQQLWYKEYGGSHSYVIRGINVLDDGRILLYGSRVDNEDGIRYPYLMLLNEDGEITSTEDIAPEKQEIVHVFYHGSSDDLYINVIQPIEKFSLFAADGRLLFHQSDLPVGTHSFDMSRIPPGIYVYLASTTNHSQSGKWIKY